MGRRVEYDQGEVPKGASIVLLILSGYMDLLYYFLYNTLSPNFTITNPLYYGSTMSCMF